MAEKKEAQQQPIIEQKPPTADDDIRKRAYEIYCARNDSFGTELYDWLKAETGLKEACATAG